MKESVVPASEFKARCLRLLDDVAQRGDSIIVTKRGHPVAKVIPLPVRRKTTRGMWKDLGKIQGDIVNFHDDWGPDD